MKNMKNADNSKDKANKKISVLNVTKIFGPNISRALEMLSNGAAKDEILNVAGSTVGVYDASFEIKEGEIFVIMGLSGSGKSTLIRCLNLLNRPTSGSIFIDGKDITKFDRNELMALRQKKISMVFQHFGLFTHRTVLKNVEYGLEVKGVSKTERAETAKKAISSVGLEGWENYYPGQLSGGMQQRVGLARALANDPDILLMDEPFSALDPLIRREMQLELLDLQSRLKKTVVFITHDINEAFKLGDRVAVMKDARVVQVGTPEEILNAPANEYIESFVKDIDRSKVLQARNVMLKPNAIISVKDGPQVAVNEMRANGISSVFVVDSDRRLVGLVTIDDAVRAINGKMTLQEIIRHDFHITKPDIYVQDLIPSAVETHFPIAVVDQSNKLLGIVVRVSVLSALI